MVEWQERITRDTNPAIRVEHDLRYAAAAPIVTAAQTWCDLGCGAGVAAADALGDARLGRVVLVDADAGASRPAGRELQARATSCGSSPTSRPPTASPPSARRSAGSPPP